MTTDEQKQIQTLIEERNAYKRLYEIKYERLIELREEFNKINETFKYTFEELERVQQENKDLRKGNEISNTRSQRRFDEILEAGKLREENFKILAATNDYASINRIKGLTGIEYKWGPLLRYSNENFKKVIRIKDEKFGTVNGYHKDVWLNVYGVDLAELLSDLPF